MSDRDRVNVFLYLLHRDCVSFGAVGRIFHTIENLHVSDTGKHAFSQPDMDAYIRSLTDRLLLTPEAQAAHAKHFNRKVR